MVSLTSPVLASASFSLSRLSPLTAISLMMGFDSWTTGVVLPKMSRLVVLMFTRKGASIRSSSGWFREKDRLHRERAHILADQGSGHGDRREEPTHQLRRFGHPALPLLPRPGKAGDRRGVPDLSLTWSIGPGLWLPTGAGMSDIPWNGRG